MRKRVVLVAASAIAFSASSLFLASPAAAAAPTCNARDSVVQSLGNKYREVPVAAGITNGGKLIEVLSNDSGTTWTIIVTTPQGVSCLIAAGEGWRMVPRTGLDPEA